VALLGRFHLLRDLSCRLDRERERDPEEEEEDDEEELLGLRLLGGSSFSFFCFWVCWGRAVAFSADLFCFYCISLLVKV